MSIFTVPIRIRSTQRLGQIAIVFTRHGLGHFIARLRLRRYLPFFDKFLLRRRPIPTESPEEISLGKRLVAIFEELGPTFIKFGQLLSSRPDLIPPDILEDLRKLQDKVAPFPVEQVYEIIKEEFGAEVGDLFDEFEETPIASGSIAQTHLARTKNGRKVVIKVRRPGIEEIVKLDMYILHRLAESVEKHIPELRNYRPKQIVEEFQQSINRELDMLNEATVTDKICSYFTNEPNILVPSVIWKLTSKRIFTMTYVNGLEFYDAIRDKTIVLDRSKLARLLIDCFMRQFLDLGLFHADPHPGNIFIIPPDKIGLVDFGMAGQLDRRRMISLIMLLTAGYYRQMDMVVDILDDMNAISPQTDTELLKRDISALLNKYQHLPLKYLNFQKVFTESTALARRHRVVLPRDLVLVGKSIVSIGGAALLLDPDLNPAEVAKPQVQSALVGLLNRNQLSREFIEAFWHSGLLIKNLPRSLRKIIRKTLRGELSVQFASDQLGQLAQELDRSSNRLSFSVIIAAIIVGSSIIFHARVGPVWHDMPILGLTGYLVAGIMGFWLVIAILRSGKLG